jgi:hypothetical protein
MSDRLALIIEELVDALRAEVREELRASAPPREAPVELVSVAEFARRAGIGRSSAYLGVADGSLRSVRVRGRRLLPASELVRLAESATPALPTERGRARRRDPARPLSGGRDAARRPTP